MIRDALGVLMIVSGEIATGLLTVAPASGSRMSVLLGGKKLAEASSAAMIFHHRVAAADHVRAFSVLTSQDSGFSTSVAAVARAGIESFARGWWLLRSDSAEELRHKGALAVASELRAAGKRGIRMRDPDLAIAQALQEAEADLTSASAGQPKLTLPGYAALAIEILEAADTSEARATYAHMSGIAHGEVTFTTGLGGNPGARPGERDWLQLPDHNFQHYALTLFAVNVQFMNVLVDSWAIADFTEVWHAALRESAAILQSAGG